LFPLRSEGECWREVVPHRRRPYAPDTVQLKVNNDPRLELEQSQTNVRHLAEGFLDTLARVCFGFRVYESKEEEEEDIGCRGVGARLGVDGEAAERVAQPPVVTLRQVASLVNRREQLDVVLLDHAGEDLGGGLLYIRVLVPEHHRERADQFFVGRCDAPHPEEELFERVDHRDLDGLD